MKATLFYEQYGENIKLALEFGLHKIEHTQFQK